MYPGMCAHNYDSSSSGIRKPPPVASTFCSAPLKTSTKCFICLKNASISMYHIQYWAKQNIHKTKSAHHHCCQKENKKHCKKTNPKEQLQENTCKRIPAAEHLQQDRCKRTKGPTTNNQQQHLPVLAAFSPKAVTNSSKFFFNDCNFSSESATVCCAAVAKGCISSTNDSASSALFAHSTSVATVFIPLRMTAKSPCN